MVNVQESPMYTGEGNPYPKTKYRILGIEEFRSFVAWYRKNPKLVAVDLETTGLIPTEDKVVTMQFGTPQQVYILDCRRFYDEDNTEATRKLWRACIQEFYHVCPMIIGQNLKFDLAFLEHHFDVLVSRLIDTRIQEQVLLSSNKGANMQALGAIYGLPVTKDDQKFTVNMDLRPDWYEPFPDHFIQYLIQDVVVPYVVAQKQQQKLALHELVPVAHLENRLVPVVASMEFAGIPVDLEIWRRVLSIRTAHAVTLHTSIQKMFTEHGVRRMTKEEWEAERKALKAAATRSYADAFLRGEYTGTVSEYVKSRVAPWEELHKKPGTQEELVKLSSPKQLREALAQIGITVTSTAEDVLENFKGNPIVAAILEWKKNNSVLTKYGEKWLQHVRFPLDAEDKSYGRVHTTFNQVIETGRFSSYEPNIQQIPAEDKKHPELSLRRAIRAKDGYKIFTCDLPNIELRILADLSGDPAMLKAFLNEEVDFYSAMAIEMFKLPKGVNPKVAEYKPGLTYRQAIKAVILATNYGGGASLVAAQTGTSLEEARSAVEKYKLTFKGAVDHLQKGHLRAVEEGYTKTALGRKRFFRTKMKRPYWDWESGISKEEFYESETWLQYKEFKSEIRGEALNAPIQGTGADILKLALVLIHEEFLALSRECRIIACLHDEVVCEAPEGMADQVKEIIAQCMMQACRQFLKVVHFPPMDVVVADFWAKEQPEEEIKA